METLRDRMEADLKIGGYRPRTLAQFDGVARDPAVPVWWALNPPWDTCHPIGIRAARVRWRFASNTQSVRGT